MTASFTAIDLDIRKLTSSIGAEISGVDINGQLDPGTVAAIRAALNEHKVLVFREVKFDKGGQQRFASTLGPLTTAHPNLRGGESGKSELLRVKHPRAAAHFHTDVSYVVNPPQLSTLRSIVIPPYGGETDIADCGAAYRMMPAPLRQLADQLWVYHSNTYDYEPDPSANFSNIEFQSLHPMVRVHPLTGERGLFLGGFARRIKGLSDDESQALLRIFAAYVQRSENVLRWNWQPNQLVMYDNRITQHRAVNNYDDHPRWLNRVTVAGDIPVGVDGERSSAVKGDASHYTSVVELPPVPVG